MPKKASVKKTTKKNSAVIKTTAIKRLPNVWQLSQVALSVLWRQRYTILGIVLIYGLVNLAVAQGFSSGLSVSSAKSQLSSIFHGKHLNLGGNLTIYALMFASIGGSSSSSNGFGYSLILVVIASLAIIWAIRNSSNSKIAKVRIRDAYYRGMYALIPFIIILLLIGIELLPMVAGISIYVSAINNAIAVTAIEKLVFVVLMLSLTSLTIYWLSSSIFALYIVTLPDMTPLKALRSAKQLVKKRRYVILPRLLFLPVMLIVISAVIMLPFISWVAPAAPWVFLVLSLLLLAITHSYLYNLYRELLVWTTLRLRIVLPS